MSDSSIALPQAVLSSTSIRIPPGGVTADSIDIIYACLPGNQPSTYGNFASIWQNSNSIPYGTSPKYTNPAIGNTPDGTFNFPNLDLTNNSYIVGFSVGPVLTSPGIQPYGNICATAFIPSVNGTPAIFDPTLNLLYVGTNSVSLQFNLPDNILPKSNGAWIGIWRSGQPSYTTPPAASAAISVDAPNGSCAINDFPIGRGLTYTVGLFTSGFIKGGVSKQTALATSLTFTNS
jgi:hypothetical protein